MKIRACFCEERYEACGTLACAYAPRLSQIDTTVCADRAGAGDAEHYLCSQKRNSRQRQRTALIASSGHTWGTASGYKSTSSVAGFVDNASQVLENDGWRRMVYIQDGDEKVRIYVNGDESALSGMTVMVVDASEAVFINIAGSISPEQLGQVVASMGLDDVAVTLNGTGTQADDAMD